MGVMGSGGRGCGWAAFTRRGNNQLKALWSRAVNVEPLSATTNCIKGHPVGRAERQASGSDAFPFLPLCLLFKGKTPVNRTRTTRHGHGHDTDTTRTRTRAGTKEETTITGSRRLVFPAGDSVAAVQSSGQQRQLSTERSV
ncbi:hypothetical protein ACLKA6_001716 [Drosophila palustris]